MCKDKSVSLAVPGSFSFRADAHCDTVTALLKNKTTHIDLEKIESFVDLQFFALYIKEEQKTKKAVKENDKYYQHYVSLLETYNKLQPILMAKDVENLQLGKVGSLLAIENAEPLAEDSEALYRLIGKGYRSFGITWSNDNSLAGGANTDSDVTDLGKDVLRSLNKEDVLVDLAHMNRKSYFTAMSLLEKPPIVTHTCCYGLCPHRRNLEDDAIKLLADAKGLMGITFVKSFLQEDGNALIDHIIDHIIYAADLIGIEQVVLGSDFDGTDLPLDMSGQKDMGKLIDAMLARDFSQQEVDLVLGENLKKYLLQMLG